MTGLGHVVLYGKFKYTHTCNAARAVVLFDPNYTEVGRNVLAPAGGKHRPGWSEIGGVVYVVLYGKFKYTHTCNAASGVVLFGPNFTEIGCNVLAPAGGKHRPGWSEIGGVVYVVLYGKFKYTHTCNAVRAVVLFYTNHTEGGNIPCSRSAVSETSSDSS